ncbi:MAG: factor-independent urate hydroxylase [Sporichthyaceae bacterium]
MSERDERGTSQAPERSTLQRAVLGPNRYGKAETRVVRVDREPAGHRVTDLNVSTALSGDLTETHHTGDNAAVLPTDSQKNTVLAFARDGIASVEDFALRLARHFVGTQPAIAAADVDVESYSWSSIGGPHSFSRDGGAVRTAYVRHEAGTDLVVAGIKDLVVLNTTASEFVGFAVDEFTTLQPASDRILATSVQARWRYDGIADPGNWDELWTASRDCLLAAFAETYSRSLQQTLFAMGARVIAEVPAVAEVRLRLPNRHHFLSDLSAFGRDNPGTVFWAADRPYGLIEGTVLREGSPAHPGAW